MNKQVAKIEAEAEAPDPLALLRQPFPPHQISRLPKETGKQRDARTADQKAGKWPDKCSVCEGYHHPKAVHLDYVGHAALTDRLLDADPNWAWEPAGYTPEGLPKFDAVGGLWIKLTVAGVTRMGYGAADGKSGGDAVKEIIGDALRNAAMRFGAALDLWHKGDLHAPEAAEGETESETEEDPETAAAVIASKAAMDLAKTEDALAAWGKGNGPMIQGLPALQAQAIRRHYARCQDALRKAAASAMPADDEIPY